MEEGMDRIFCKIVRGEVPCGKVHERAGTLVFMDVAGDVDGHLLAIPKRHFKNILDCDRAARSPIQTYK